MRLIKVFCLILIVVCFIWIVHKDIKDRKIPNIPVLLLLLAGLYYRPLEVALPGAAVCFCTMLFLYLLGIVGGGDVKLATAVGALLGSHEGLAVLVIASFMLAALEAYKQAKKGELENWLVFNLNALKMGVHVKYLAESIKKQEHLKKAGAPLGAFIAPVCAMFLLMNAVRYWNLF